MRNVHTRLFASATPAQIRCHIENVWTGTDADIFPRDFIGSWRKNPPGVAPLAALPGETVLGHGPFRFRLTEWDGARWRVEVRSKRIEGWHGFDLAEHAGGGSELTHTIEAELRGMMRVVWPMVIAPMHDYVVEAMFDRLEEALRTGVVPLRTARPQPWYVRLLVALRRGPRKEANRSAGRSGVGSS